MSAQIIPIPVVRKRGRKVTRGPCASVTVIYAYEDAKGVCDELGRVEHQGMRIRELVDIHRARGIEREATAQVWIDLSPTVLRWPAWRRVRSMIEVDRLKRGADYPEEERAEHEHVRAQFLADVEKRRQEIHAEMVDG